MAYRARHPLLILLACATLLTSCSHRDFTDALMVDPPKISDDTNSGRLLKKLPPAMSNTVVSVYEFQDQTGQLKANDNFADYSRAVTQGGLALLNKSLLEAGNGHWFDVVERGGLKNLLQERQIIQLTRAQYAPPDAPKTQNLSPLLYAGMLIEGGIVGFDSNISTGGVGANYLGVGGDVQYRRDIVTVNLRAVSVENGQVLLSVTSEKTLYSTGIDANVFKYVSFDHLLQAESGFTLNEPPQLAVRQAIETAVYSMIMEGARKHYWQFADPSAGRVAMDAYMATLHDDEPPVYGDYGIVTHPKQDMQPAQAPQTSAPVQASPGSVSSDRAGIAGGVSNSATLKDPDSSTVPNGGGQNNNNLYPVVPANPADYPVPPQGKK